LSLPLAPPAGMRDLLPAEVRGRRALVARMLAVFERFGYAPIATPPFEYGAVLERGLDTVDPRDLIRFVEPESGEVAILRPDITPQVARIVATRLRALPPPIRLSYEGTVIRRRRGRARRHGQLSQVGVELLGKKGAPGDVEVVLCAIEACDAVGLDAMVELGHVRVADELVGRLPPEAREHAAGALLAKDSAALAEIARSLDRPADRELLVDLPALYGDATVLDHARPLFERAGFGAPIAELEAVVVALAALGRTRVELDLGELRGRSYYTGVSFALLAKGPGEPIGRGGRYDRLLERFGRPLEATGFAIDVENVAWALGPGRALGSHVRPSIALAVESAADPRAAALRATGLSVHVVGPMDAGAHAGAHALSAAVFCEGDVLRVRTSSGAEHVFSEVDAAAAFVHKLGPQEGS
jgi:ATP phosphoribosyltransferase regulatory subunit